MSSKTNQDLDQNHQEWLDSAPPEWELRDARFLFREIDERSDSGDGELLSLSKEHGLLPHSELTDEQHRAEDLEGYKKCEEGDIVMNKMQAWNGRFGLADQEGLVSPDYTVLRPNSGVSPQFFLYLFTTPRYINQFYWRSRGIGEAYLRLNTQFFYDVPLVCPPIETQEQIVDHINDISEQIDNLITNLENLQERLQEKWISEISYAVRKGIEPNRQTKISELDWLGQVPVEWDTKPLKFCCHRIVDAINDTAPTTSDGYGWMIRTTQIKDASLDLQDADMVDEETFYEWNRRATPQAGDVVFTREAPVGESCVIPQNKNVILGQRMMLIRTDDSILKNKYLLYWFYSKMAEYQYELNSHGSTVSHIRVKTVPNFNITVPPRQEQSEIVEYLDEQQSRVESMKSQSSKMIKLLRERKTSFIDMVVTGQIDIKEAQSTTLETSS